MHPETSTTPVFDAIWEAIWQAKIWSFPHAPTLTIMLSPEGKRTVFQEAAPALSFELRGKTIFGLRYAVDSRQKELFKVVER